MTILTCSTNEKNIISIRYYISITNNINWLGRKTNSPPPNILSPEEYLITITNIQEHVS